MAHQERAALLTWYHHFFLFSLETLSNLINCNEKSIVGEGGTTDQFFQSYCSSTMFCWEKKAHSSADQVCGDKKCFSIMWYCPSPNDTVNLSVCLHDSQKGVISRLSSATTTFAGLPHLQDSFIPWKWGEIPFNLFLTLLLIIINSVLIWLPVNQSALVLFWCFLLFCVL